MRTNPTPEPATHAEVAQISNLLYRRFPIGRCDDRSSTLEVSGAVQNGILRYSRLEICATRKRAFTMIEIMVVVIVIAVLAAIIMPQFIGTTDDAKISAAKANVSELANALQRFYLHLDRYPSTEEGLKVLITAPTGEESKWRGPYVSTVPVDPWGDPFQYRAPGVHQTATFDVWSRGADHADGGEGKNADIGNW